MSANTRPLSCEPLQPLENCAFLHGIAYFPNLHVSRLYPNVVRKAFRTRQTGTGGRPRLVAWPELAIAQVAKQYAGRAMSSTLHRLVQGSTRLFLTLLGRTPGCQVRNTAYIERLNGTFRSRLAVLGRRTRRSARNMATVARGM